MMTAQPLTGNKLVAQVLQTPPDKRVGVLGYLVDRWHKSAKVHGALELNARNLERMAAEANTQLVKAAGALEQLESMIAEHIDQPTKAETAPATKPVGEPSAQ